MLVLVPIIELIVGAIVTFVLGLYVMIQKGHGGNIMTSGLIMFILLGGIAGGSGSILLIVLDN